MATPVSSLHSSQFPKGFTFGSSSSSYQIEGASKEGGRGPSIWDTFALKEGLIPDPSIGNVAIDHYHRYKGDVRIMKQIGLNGYRFSLSWSRILPKGSIKGGVNKEGIAFYNNLINELIDNGIEPFVTLFHWDSPQALEDEYGGFLSPKIVNDFRDYAEVCFREFGDRVKYWTTINEPWFFSFGGYTVGTLAPGRGYRPIEQETSKLNLLPPSSAAYSPLLKSQGPSSVGDPGTEPYLVGHHLLLSHAAAAKTYNEIYKKSQKGVVGISLCSQWSIAYTESEEDAAAVERSHDYRIGWFMDPLTTGDYPATMRAKAGTRLPKFTKEESKMLIGSIDFLGVNYYTAYYISDAPSIAESHGRPHGLTDPLLSYTQEKDGIPLGPQGGSPWLFSYPDGLKKLLHRLKIKYNNPVIYITENGIDEERNDKLSLWDSLFDQHRVSYHGDHLFSLKEAIDDGSNVKGYFAWSILDNFEWSSGFTMRFGMNFIDYNNDLTRYPKLSAGWFRQFLKKQDDN